MLSFVCRVAQCLFLGFILFAVIFYRSFFLVPIGVYPVCFKENLTWQKTVECFHLKVVYFPSAALCLILCQTHHFFLRRKSSQRMPGQDIVGESHSRKKLHLSFGFVKYKLKSNKTPKSKQEESKSETDNKPAAEARKNSINETAARANQSQAGGKSLLYLCVRCKCIDFDFQFPGPGPGPVSQSQCVTTSRCLARRSLRQQWGGG